MLQSPPGRGIAAAALLILATLAPPAGAAPAGPVAPCAAGSGAPVPAYGAPNQAPRVEVWRDVELAPGSACAEVAQGRMELVVALAARFESAAPIEALAGRMGTISATEGLLYWSTSDAAWRPLISEAYALEDSRSETPRADFSAEEVLSGRPLAFAQNDTRSSGTNHYSLRARAAGADRLVIEIVNLDTIRTLLLPLFDPGSLVAVHVFERLEGGLWGYYGLSAVRDGPTVGHERSFINRADAVYRFLSGVPIDRDAPLAP